MKKLLSLLLCITMLAFCMPCASLADSALDTALNVKGGKLTFDTAEKYPWVASGDYAESTNGGCDKSKSVVTLKAGKLDAGTLLEFDWKVSCESDFDFLAFYVNGKKEASITGVVVVAWHPFDYVVKTAGNYTFEWKYEKDSYFNENDDKAYLDNVALSKACEPKSISLVPLYGLVQKGSTYTFDVKENPKNAYARITSWTSSDPAVAAVNKDGLIVAISCGSTIITAVSDNGCEASAQLDVIEGMSFYAYYASASATTEKGIKLVDAFSGAMSHILTLPNTPYAAAYVNGNLYAIIPVSDTKTKLYTINLNTKQYTSVDTNVLLCDLTYDRTTNLLYGLGSSADSGESTIYTLDTKTGKAELVAEITGTSQPMLTLACSYEGVLYGITLQEGALYTIDKVTGETMLVGKTGLTPNFVQSMEFHPQTNQLIWAACENTIKNGIYTVDTATGAVRACAKETGNLCAMFFEQPTPTPTASPTPSVSPTSPTPESPTPTPDLSPTPTQPGNYQKGDANRDGKVNTGDAAAILRYAAKLMTFDEQQLALADFNGDGKVNTGDAAAILRFTVGK